MTVSSRIQLNPLSIIILLTVVQVLCATYFLNIGGFAAINSVLFFLCGLVISFCLIKTPALATGKPVFFQKQFVARLFIIALLLPFSYSISATIMDNTPVQKEYADMLPIIKAMCQRFLNGHWQNIYDPISEIWNGVQPIYLPATWLPFTSSEVLHFDPRWVTVGGIWLSVIICVWPGKWKINWQYLLFTISILVLLAWLHYDEVNNVIRLTEEGVVFFYYTLIVAAIVSGNGWLIGIAAALCLFSRYSIIGWLPFVFLFSLFAGERKLLSRILMGGIISTAILIIPFGIKPLLLHLDLPSQYIQHADRVWSENPEYFKQSLGLAKFFGPDHTTLLHYVLLIGTFAIPVLFFLSIRSKKIPVANALLAGLQLSVTIFYNFIDVSYLYLFYTPVFVSLCIAGFSLATYYRKNIV
ncbi:MAG TPA: hypothetical protein VHM26_18735 [Chitinophagaceae bacterium]|nr:hypothetical protein [Chitinophagaceae bacterium]